MFILLMYTNTLLTLLRRRIEDPKPPNPKTQNPKPPNLKPKPLWQSSEEGFPAGLIDEAKALAEGEFKADRKASRGELSMLVKACLFIGVVIIIVVTDCYRCYCYWSFYTY